MNKQHQDSLFSARNHFDGQISDLSDGGCESLLEAGVRKLAQKRGPIHAASRLYRLADICSGAYVFPIDHWKQTAEPTPTETSEDRKLSKSIVRAAFLNGIAFGFLAGVILVSILKANGVY